jgi:aminoglycoside phosphotransferase (APT) family kinase protein
VTVATDLEDRLIEVLRRAAGEPDLSYDGQPALLGGGFWAELVAFSLTKPPPGWPTELVARVMPDPAVARKETIVQTVMSAAGFPTPAIRAQGGPDDGLGRAFMIMDRAPGAPLLPSLSGAAAIPAAVSLARQLPEELAVAMAALHALDPGPVRAALGAADEAPSTIPSLLVTLEYAARTYRRDDLAAAATWLIGHPKSSMAPVVCHGDLHPFNMLIDGRQVTVLDWSASLLAPRAHDVAFTSLMLSEPPLNVPGWLRPAVRRAGRVLAARFVRRYEAHSGVTVSASDVAWHQAVVCLRALTEVASWVHDGLFDGREGHPWLVCGQHLAARLTGVTGVRVRPR